MSDTTASLRRKIDSAGDLQAVVRAMKAMAASNIGQYDRSVLVLADYHRTVELGLGACFRRDAPAASMLEVAGRPEQGSVGAIVFGSDQGLVGRFNEEVAAHAIQALATLPAGTTIWAVGERVHARLEDAGLPPKARFDVPGSVEAITPLIGQLLLAGDARSAEGAVSELHLFYNHRSSEAACVPTSERLLPLDGAWHQRLAELPWPTNRVPELMGSGSTTLRALIGEYLFISLFRACAESLATENASRLAAMERADKNIADLLTTLQGSFHRLRQSSIDEELFDVIAGFELAETLA